MGALLVVLSRLPLPAGDALGWVVAAAWWWLVPVRRAVAVANVRRAFPDWPRRRVARTLRHMMHDIVLGYVELLVSERTGRHMVEGEGADTLPPGSLVLAGHGGSWDIALLAMADRTPTALFLKPPSSPSVRAWIAAVRARHDVLGLGPGTTLADGYRALADGRALLMIQDQRHNAGLWSPFFGVPCRTSAGFATAALDAGRPVYGVWQYREARGRHRFRIAPLPLPAPTGDRAADVQRITDAANAWYEARIRECPHGWLWLHDRWRGAPQVSPPPPAR